MRPLHLFVPFVLLLLISCSAPPGPPIDPVTLSPPWFEDISDKVGLDFVHEAGPTGHFFMPQIMGSGAALFDFDGDGRLDIYLLQGAGPDSKSTNRLFRQDAQGHFTDVSKGSGLDVSGYGTGVAIGDVNNDGKPDVLITEYGRLRLFLNLGNSTFRDISQGASLQSNLWGTSASFVDYDRDGRLDLVVVNYVVNDTSKICYDGQGRRDFCHPRQFAGSVTKLFHNLGPGKSSAVSFEDVTAQAGLGQTVGPGLGVVCADFDGDHWPDLFIANDGQPNRLWINQKNGTFREEAVERGLAFDGMGHAPANMGVALGDADGDGLFDVFVTHLTDETHTLWCQSPRGVFRDRTMRSGLAPPGSRGTGFGVVLADFDLDGNLDVAVVNGRVSRKRVSSEDTLGPFWSQYAERNQLFANEGQGRFRDISAANPGFCGALGVFRGLAIGDIDNDGAPDLLVTALAGRARLFRNVAPRSGKSLSLRLVDPKGLRDAYGAEVTVRAGNRTWRRWVNPGSSYLCSNDARVPVGLGPVASVDSVEVLWPDGQREIFPGILSEIVLTKGTGRPVTP